MVALLLRLRFRVLANTLLRNPLQFVAVVVGGATALPLLLMAFGLLWVAPGVDPRLPVEVPAAATTIGGAAVVLGWVVVPLVVNGVEQTLDPARLAVFPLRTRQVLVAQLLVGVTWVPGATTILIGVMDGVAWRFEGAVAAVAAGCGLLAALTAIAGSRAVATLTGNLLAGTTVRARIGVIGGLAVVLAGPAVAAAIVGVSTGPDGFRHAADVLAFSPIGAAWAVPGWVAAGHAGAAAISGAVAVATPVVVVAVWARALRASLAHRGAVASRARRAGHLGPLGWVPATAWGAIWGRSLVYWFRDARYARQLTIIPVLPALLLLEGRVTGIEGIGLAAGPIVAATLPLAVFAGISYDGTAWAAHLAAGVRGVDDRIGRLLGLATIAVPAVVAVQLATAAVLDAWTQLPTLLALSTGLLLSAFGVVSVSSARIVVPVPRSRRNPFSASAGAGTTSVAASYAVTGITLALALPELVLGVLALALDLPWLGWIALGVALVVGAVAVVAGVRLGGAWLDRRGPETLVRLRAVRSG